MPRKKKSEITVPKARLLPSGKWFIQLRLNGESIPVTEDTEAKCRAKALAIKAGYVNAPTKTVTAPTLGEVVDKYISSKDGVISPSTIRSYKAMREHRFENYMSKPIDGIAWQMMVSDEAKHVNAKYLKNAWALVSAAVKLETGTAITVTLPQVVSNEKEYLDAEQIKTFVKAVKGRECEVPALLALHSLRMSEISGLTWKDIDLKKNIIHVRGARVMDEDLKLVYKKTNKNKSSRRDVPIIIPELKTALQAMPHTGEFIVTMTDRAVYGRVNTVCRRANLPEVGVQGLRHSFASLCYSLGVPEKVTQKIGGWADDATMKKIYTHISDKDINKQAEKLADFFTVQNANENANEK